MANVLVVTLGNTAESLISSARRIVGDSTHVDFFSVAWDGDLEKMKSELGRRIDTMDDGRGVVVLSDICGSSATNLARGFARPGRVVVLTGVNLPMVINAFTQAHELSAVDAANLMQHKSQSHILTVTR